MESFTTSSNIVDKGPYWPSQVSAIPPLTRHIFLYFAVWSLIWISILHTMKGILQCRINVLANLQECYFSVRKTIKEQKFIVFFVALFLYIVSLLDKTNSTFKTIGSKSSIGYFLLRTFSEQMRSSLNCSDCVKKCHLLSCAIVCPIAEADIHLLKSSLFDYFVLTSYENSLLVILEFK